MTRETYLPLLAPAFVVDPPHQCVLSHHSDHSVLLNAALSLVLLARPVRWVLPMFTQNVSKILLQHRLPIILGSWALQLLLIPLVEIVYVCAEIDETNRPQMVQDVLPNQRRVTYVHNFVMERLPP